jgi:hypothetical protein
MSDLNLAQNHARNLARIPMIPVTHFEIDGKIGVMPSAEYDGDEDPIINDYDPGRLCRLRWVLPIQPGVWAGRTAHNQSD